jgi:hypothetical protein
MSASVIATIDRIVKPTQQFTRGRMLTPDTAALESIGGSLEVIGAEDAAGLRVKLPLTLAIISALILICERS